MHLLIAHRDVELGDQLVQMIHNYSTHDADLAETGAAAIAWARRQQQCALLLTQVQGDGIDGLALGGQLSEIFPGLQTLFLPGYPASSQPLEVIETKVFPEPIDGEALLAAIDRAAAVTPGTPDFFHVVDVLQMCCLSRRGGAIQIVNGPRSGIVFLRNGQIAHAETTARRGRDALREMVGWEFVEFAYDGTVRPPVETIPAPWDKALIEAVTHNRQTEPASELSSGA